MKTNLIIGILLAAILTFGSGSAWAEQQNPIDCSTAKDDIAHLKHEKKSTDEREMKGVLAILPIGLVVNAVHSASTSDSPKEMEIKKYNQKISDRIAEIQKSCNIE